MKHIALIDDDEVIHYMIERLFRKKTSRLTPYKKADDVINQLPSDLPDIMVIDIHMPRMEGYEILDELNSLCNLASINIIISSEVEPLQSIEAKFSKFQTTFVLKEDLQTYLSNLVD